MLPGSWSDWPVGGRSRLEAVLRALLGLAGGGLFAFPARNVFHPGNDDWSGLGVGFLLGLAVFGTIALITLINRWRSRTTLSPSTSKFK
jgi:hypothetical protein